MALHGPARVLREIEAKRPVLARHAAIPGRFTTCGPLLCLTPTILTSPHELEVTQCTSRVPNVAACWTEPHPLRSIHGTALTSSGTVSGGTSKGRWGLGAQFAKPASNLRSATGTAGR
ncbi:hypothetical protein [Streptomyces sp. NPDC048438]|uniref:hypothetical protein n=1 Tax=Streptomyces sp. NPDC048438 TaxID=3365551 RepID=UPI003717C7C3